MADMSTQLERYFTPLIGTEQDERDLTTRLGAAVVLTMANEPAADPYLALNKAWTMASEQIIKSLVATDMPVDERATYGEIADNAVIGPQFLSIILRTIGHIYRQDATVPQYRSTVRRSVDNATFHAHGLAFRERKAANHAKMALLSGVQMGGDTLSRLFDENMGTELAFYGNPDTMRNLYDTVTSHDGQLTIMPNFVLPPRVSDSTCPAAVVHLDRPEHDQTALLTTMRMFGNVAIEYIYPEQFAVDPAR